MPVRMPCTTRLMAFASAAAVSSPVVSAIIAETAAPSVTIACVRTPAGLP